MSAQPLNCEVIGASGKTGLLITKLLLDDGHAVRAISRNIPNVPFEGFEFVSGDLTEDDPAPWMIGGDAVVFAAGGDTATENVVDHIGAARCAAAATDLGIRDFILISAHGAHDPNSWGEEFRSYLEAKAAGESAVRAHFPKAIILRPGILTDDPPTGTVTARREHGSGEAPVSRADVALCVRHILAQGVFAGKTLEIVGGEAPINEALDNCLL